MRRIGTARDSESYSFWLASATWSSSAVSVGPGHTTLTVTPLDATSRARPLLNEMTPPFVPEYTTSPDEPTRPASDAMLMIRPDFRSIIDGTMRWHIVTGPRRLTWMSLSQVCGSLSTNFSILSMPALLTRM